MDNSDIIESTRVTEFEGQEWPCFVFPDHSVPPGAIEPKPNKHALPVFVLQRHHFEWRSPDATYDFDPCQTRECGASRADKEREQAFEEAMQFHSMKHYHDVAWQKQAAKDMAIVLDSDDDDDNTKVKPRKRTSLKPGSDDDVSITSVTKKKRPYISVFKRPGKPSPSPTPRKKGKPSPRATPALPFEEEEDDIDLPDPSTFTPTRRQDPKPATPKWKPSGKLPKVAPDDYVTRKQLELLMMKKGDSKSATPEKAKALEPVKDPLKINIYVGDENKLFILDRALIQKYPSFMKHITGDNKNGFEICNETFEKFKSTPFESLVSWLKTADYAPRLIEGNHRHLENIKSAKQFEDAAEEASALWGIAHKLELTDLQELIYRKIEVQTPLAAKSLLMFTNMVFWNSSTDAEIDDKMRRMLRQDIAARMHEIIDEEPMLFNRVLKSNVELANYIYTYRLKHPYEESAEHISESDEDDAEDDDDE
ncbi:unnamed protein product [Aureobasidium vineae]|uniref:BTB domain-containing protein n=1 Tax=Aureobasidium vineae TaxID=2773715 RepID=A0A9N8JD03_9PEZI|nr:unnamed protein product [Aureobasidium vineae]